jgi:hypothetical protein
LVQRRVDASAWRGRAEVVYVVEPTRKRLSISALLPARAILPCR